MYIVVPYWAMGNGQAWMFTKNCLKLSFGQKMAKPHQKNQGKPKIEPGFRLTIPKDP